MVFLFLFIAHVVMVSNRKRQQIFSQKVKKFNPTTRGHVEAMWRPWSEDSLTIQKGREVAIVGQLDQNLDRTESNEGGQDPSTVEGVV